ncbi:TIGR02206 family membrane protein [Gammaproteobacteria bacterium]|nr:TIGR02206 family membrane protein [Gammaproteobacteria bacterium]
MNASPFVLFGNIHIITMLVILSVSILLPLIYKNKSEAQNSVMTKVIAYIIIAHVVISPFKDLFLLENPYNWREVLPFHMCDLSEIFIAWFLLGGPKILYKCAFFWGIGGATMAIITPDISYHDLDYGFFMIGHGMIVLGIMYATIALGNRPYATDILTVSLITACILLPITYIINLLLGEPANFWYLMAKPEGASLMDAFPEPPYHLLVLMPLAIATFFIIYAPYFIKDRLQK